MRLLVAGVSLLAVAILQPANAAEIQAKPKRERAVERPAAQPQRPAPQPQRPAPTQTANWTGGQLGGSNGVSSVNNSFVDPGSFICPFGTTFNSNCFETPFAFSGNKTSYTIGPFVGYRVQLGWWVVGIEGDWSWKRAETSSNLTSSTQFFSGSVLRTDQFSGSVKQTWDASIRGRVGTLVTPWSLLYLTGGVAFGEISGTFAYNGSLFSCSSPCSTTPYATATSQAAWSDTRVGSTVGAGWETEVWAGWKARAEYRYTDFGRYTKAFGLTNTCAGFSGTSCIASPSGGVSIDLRESFHTFRVGLAVDLP
jgi:outer membrane immunogenic protein